MSGTVDVFDVTCKQRHRGALKPFLNGAKNVDVDGILNEAQMLSRENKAVPLM